jgi:hypothetical protein
MDINVNAEAVEPSKASEEQCGPRLADSGGFDAMGRSTDSQLRIGNRMVAAANLLRQYGASEENPLPKSVVERYHRIGPKSLTFLLQCGLVVPDDIERIDELSSKTRELLAAYPALKTRSQVLAALEAGVLTWGDATGARGTYFNKSRLIGMGRSRFRELCAWSGFNGPADFPRPR